MYGSKAQKSTSCCCWQHSLVFSNQKKKQQERSMLCCFSGRIDDSIFEQKNTKLLEKSDTVSEYFFLFWKKNLFFFYFFWILFAITFSLTCLPNRQLLSTKCRFTELPNDDIIIFCKRPLHYFLQIQGGGSALHCCVCLFVLNVNVILKQKKKPGEMNDRLYQ